MLAPLATTTDRARGAVGQAVSALAGKQTVMNRSVATRHLAAAAWVSHGLRNLIAPAQLRLDANLLRGNEVAVGKDELVRMRAVLQDVIQTMDGLDLLRLDPTDEITRGGTPWPEALRALLSCITAGPPSILELNGDARDVARRAPGLFIAHLLVDLALAAQRSAPGVEARYCVGVDSELVTVKATFGRVDAKVVSSLARVVRHVAEDALVSANSSGTGVLVQVTDQGDVVCQMDMPSKVPSDTSDTEVGPVASAGSFSVLCIDDNEQLMDALEARLKQADGFSHFVRSRSVPEALAKLEHASVSLVLVDVHLSSSHDPLVSMALLRARSPNARIALFSGSTDQGLMQRAMSNGADGFVFKGMPSHGLVDAIVRLAHGEQVWAADAD